jgi:hypothetical protein
MTIIIILMMSPSVGDPPPCDCEGELSCGPLARAGAGCNTSPSVKTSVKHRIIDLSFFITSP